MHIDMRIKNFKILIISVFVLVVGFRSQAQQTAVYSQPDAYYQSALALFNKQQYGPSQKLFQNTINLIKDPYSIMRINAEYYKALCSVELFNDDAELLLLKFIKDHPESMYIKHIYYQLGIFQYRKKGYSRALKSFAKVDVFDLTKEEQIEYYFKRAYAYFKRDSIKLAKKYFFEIINKESKYKAPAVYYYSHIAYTEGNYETALKGFLSLKNNETFKAVVPYYVTHIYYMQKNYKELLKIAPNLLKNSTPKRQPEIARLIGEAYYRTGKYKEAIPYLERYYQSRPNSISNTNKYQMAYAYYKMGRYEQAIPYFQSIANEKNKMGQYASYHLAICYVKMGKKSYALNAFKQAYDNKHDPSITSDALYNFAKLSYELDYNPYNQAVKAFRDYVNKYPNSEHREEAMTYLTKMYLSTNNYEQALKSIEKIQDKSPELQLAYQRILYSVGVQQYTKGDYQKAIAFFDRAIQINKNQDYTAKARYWKAESYYQLKNFKASIDTYKEFLISQGSFVLPMYNLAHYNLGYAYFKLKNYKESNKEFRLFILNTKTPNSVTADDAYNRIGDSYFIQSNFSEAINNYDKAIAIGKRDVDYSLYKKAEAFGPLKEYQQKAATFSKLVDSYPNSTYAGNAEYALAQTYYKVLNDNAKAIMHYEHIISKYPAKSNFVKSAKLDLGYLYNNIDKTPEAIALLKSVYIDYKGSRESKEALSALQGIYLDQGNVDDFFAWIKSQGISVSVSVQDSANYYVAENAYMDNDCNTAIKAFEHYIQRFPTGSFLNNAHFYKANCEFKLKNYVMALNDYQYIVDHSVMLYMEKALKKMAYINYDLFKDYPAARKVFVDMRKYAESKDNYRKATIGIMRCDWFTENYDSVLVSVQQVLNLENLNPSIIKEAKTYEARVYMKRKDWDKSIPILQSLKKYSSSQESAEAQYDLAYIAYQKQEYDSAEALAYHVIQQEPSYEYWVVKAFVLSADIFIKTKNLNQAKATLTSIVENYSGDDKLLQEAKDKLKEVNAMLNQKKEMKQDDEMIIDLGNDNGLFIDTNGEKDLQFEEDFEEDNDSL